MDLASYVTAIWPYLGTYLGFGLAFVVIARLMREKRRPSATVAWLLIIWFIPPLGVPLYLIFGGRKISRLTRKKSSLNIAPTDESGTISSSAFGVMSRGNRTEMQLTGVQAFKSLVREIRNAHESIEITTFILNHDSIGRNIIKELSAKAEAGVEVRLLLDAVGSFGMKTLYMHDLKKAGGEIERFMPIFPFLSFGGANLRNHRKLAIFDRKRAIIGGRNIGKEYMGPIHSPTRWKDLSLLIEGPAVMQLSTIFEADWAFACSKKNAKPRDVKTVPEYKGPDPSTIEIMVSGPDTRGDPLYEKILSIIQEAKESVTIVTPYFIPDEVLQRSLMVKARSGKTVRLLVPKRSNHPVTDLARNHFLRELSEAGVEILLFNAGMLHGKVALVDRKIAMTGSANIDLRSLFVNYELGAFFYSEKDLAEISDWIEELSRSTEIFKETLEDKQPLFKSIAEDISRLITPLL